MGSEERFLLDVGLKDLPFPIRALSKVDPEGQATIAAISLTARLMHEFEAGWIDRFIEVVHSHRDRIGTSTLQHNVIDYMKALKATLVKATFDYPLFIQKQTPVSGKNCLVQVACACSAKAVSVEANPTVSFRVSVPCITTYPARDSNSGGGLLGQLSTVVIETQSRRDVFAEDLVALVDRCALSPIYSFLDRDDEEAVIRRIHSERKTSVVMVDEIKTVLAADRSLDFYSVRCMNFGMLHSYSTVIGTEKGWWVPSSGIECDEP